MEKEDIYDGVPGACVLGWTTHVKCKTRGMGRFTSHIHTHELVSSPVITVLERKFMIATLHI